MLDVIQKLLILQDRDKSIIRINAELTHIGPERAGLHARIARAQHALEAAKLKLRQLEADRNKLELEVAAKKQLIEKYSIQQFQTKKNEEYRALAHEIENCRAAIVKIEDEELNLMEGIDSAQKEAAAASRESEDAKRMAEKQISDLGGREESLRKELATLEADRENLADAVEENARSKYERLLRNKRDKVLVGVAHSVCGGCHMQLPPQIILSCQGHQDIVACPNCGRILYYTRDMDLAIAQ